MISIKKIKFIISLQKKKVRDEENLFVIEGEKIVKEFLNAKFPVKILIAKPDFINGLPAEFRNHPNEIIEVGNDDLKRISNLKTPHNAIAVVPIQKRIPAYDKMLDELSVALDFVQDPGNLGTIIRAAAWFGIRNIICSEDCADLYNPKVIQSTMGAILCVNVYYTDLKKILILANEKKTPVFGTVLTGESIYDHRLYHKGVILLGNESRGISEELMPYVNEKLIIPGTFNIKRGIDSLNVGMAASIVLSEFRRRAYDRQDI